jgi:hypothetical protein
MAYTSKKLKGTKRSKKSKHPMDQKKSAHYNPNRNWVLTPAGEATMEKISKKTFCGPKPIMSDKEFVIFDTIVGLPEKLSSDPETAWKQFDKSMTKENGENWRPKNEFMQVFKKYVRVK